MLSKLPLQKTRRLTLSLVVSLLSFLKSARVLTLDIPGVPIITKTIRITSTKLLATNKHFRYDTGENKTVSDSNNNSSSNNDSNNNNNSSNSNNNNDCYNDLGSTNSKLYLCVFHIYHLQEVVFDHDNSKNVKHIDTRISRAKYNRPRT